jgi:aminoglycoside 6-adenylyltransferase
MSFHMFNSWIRAELHHMINWYIGTRHGFDISTGKDGKYFKKYLSPELYSQYAATYSGSGYADIWVSIDAMCDLFHTLADTVAAHFGFTYRQNEEAGIREYLRMVREDEGSR